MGETLVQLMGVRLVPDNLVLLSVVKGGAENCRTRLPWRFFRYHGSE